MSVKYGILKKQILATLEAQSIVFNGQKHFKLGTSMRWFIYLTELSKIYCVTSFHMKKSHVMTEIHVGLIVQ